MVRLKIIALAVLGAATALLLQAGTAGQVPAKETEVKLEVVKKDDYLKTMKELVGKIVVVDVWGEFCPPCKAEFPHLVERHEKYAGKGVACVSLSVDLPENKDDALKFLQKQKAGFTNLLLDERISQNVMNELKARGHKVETRSRWNSGAAPVMVKMIADGVLEAGADPWGYRVARAW